MQLVGVMAHSLRLGRGGAGQGGRAQVGVAEQVSWALGCAVHVGSSTCCQSGAGVLRWVANWCTACVVNMTQNSFPSLH